jgi:hypothetical protein
MLFWPIVIALGPGFLKPSPMSRKSNIGTGAGARDRQALPLANWRRNQEHSGAGRVAIFVVPRGRNTWEAWQPYSGARMFGRDAGRSPLVLVQALSGTTHGGTVPSPTSGKPFASESATSSLAKRSASGGRTCDPFHPTGIQQYRS